MRISHTSKVRLVWCLIFLLLAGSLHTFRWWTARDFYDQREATRWGGARDYAQVSVFLDEKASLTRDNVKELEYKVNQRLVQDAVVDSEESSDSRDWEDCYSAQGVMTLSAGTESVEVDAVGTGGEFFLFHPLTMANGTYYRSDSLMQDEILLDEETAWKLFGSNDIVGRIVTVDNTALTITGVYSREDSFVHERAGRPSYMVFVSYKSLLQFGAVGQGAQELDGQETGESAANTKDAADTANMAMLTRTAGFHRIRAFAADGPVEEDITAGPGDEGPGGSDGSSDSTEDTDPSGADSSAQDAGTGGSDSGAGSSGETETLPDGAGTTNTSFEDTGEITCYEIVMPNPVEGYALQVVSNIIGTDRCVIVDNTNRYRASNFADRLLKFGTWSMRQSAVRYPYWENVAVYREEIFTLLFAVEVLSLAMVLILTVLVIIYYFRHKSWTLAGNIRQISDRVYERQSRKRYPEYYEDALPDRDESERPDPEEEST